MALLRHSLGEINKTTPALTGLHSDLVEGLRAQPKRIPSKYFYDTKGSQIFQKITCLEEYYPTRCEAEILQTQSSKILSQIKIQAGQTLNIIELGAGDGKKTIHLLREAVQNKIDLAYKPVDISAGALQTLKRNISAVLPEVQCQPVELDIETDMHRLPVQRDAVNLILYLGSSIGNFSPVAQKSFLLKTSCLLGDRDCMLIGFDLKKDPLILQRAYDDTAGVTREFNHNLLMRLNRELQADFDLTAFRHMALYNPRSCAMESWLISLQDQTVELAALGLTVPFKASEGVHVETSWKFSTEEIKTLSGACGWTRIKNVHDPKNWYALSLWLR